MNGFRHNLSVDGGSGSDRVEADHSGTPVAAVVSITEDTVSGVAQGLLSYSNVEERVLDLGAGADQITINATHSDTLLRVNSGAGADRIKLGQGDTGNETLDGIQGFVDVRGQEGNDQLIVTDSGDLDANVGVLTENRILGLGLGAADDQTVNIDAGVNYSDFEKVEFALGAGADQLTISSLNTATDLNAGEGLDALLITGDLKDYRASLDINGGGNGDILNIAPEVENPLQMTLDQVNGQGMLSDIAMALDTEVRFSGMGALNLQLTDLADVLTVEALATPATIASGAGDDDIQLVHVSQPVTVNLGAGQNRTELVNASAPVNVIGSGAPDGFDHLVVDASTTTSQITGQITNQSASVGQLTGLTNQPVSFDKLDRVEAILGEGNDNFTVNHSLVDTAVILHGGKGNDAFVVEQIGVLETQLVGGDNEDRVTVFVEGAPTENQFATLALDVDELIVDNTTGNGNHWISVDGIELRANSGAGEFLVMNTDGAELTDLRAGSGQDRLETRSATPGEVAGLVDDHRVELRQGAEVLEQSGRDGYHFYDVNVVSMDGSLSGTNYVEDGFVLSSPSLSKSNLHSASITTTNSADRVQFASENSSEIIGVYALDVSMATSGSQSITIEAVTLTGETVAKTYHFEGAAGPQQILLDDNLFGAVRSISWVSQGIVVDNIVAQKLVNSGFAPQVADVDTLVLNNDININTSAKTVNGVSNGGTLNGVGVFISVKNNILEVRFAGNLIIGDNVQVNVSGSANLGISLQAAGDVSVGDNFRVNMNANYESRGYGGGQGGAKVTGGTGTSGSGGGSGGSTSGSASNGGSGGKGESYPDRYYGGAGGRSGNWGSGSNGTSSGNPGTPGGSGTAGQNSGGGAGTGGTAGSRGSSADSRSGGRYGGGGDGGSPTSLGNGGSGDPGGSGRDGQAGIKGGSGGSGGHGKPGANNGSGLLISGGSGGGAGGSGGGGAGGSGGAGGGSGGGGGGGGAGGGAAPFYWWSSAGGTGGSGGRGGDGGRGGNGATGGDSGTGGGGGGAFELVALGDITIDNGNLTAVGGQGRDGKGPGTVGPVGGSDGNHNSGRTNGSSGSGTAGTRGGSGGNGGHGGHGGAGGAGGSGGTGGSGSGGAGGTIKLYGTNVDASGVSVNTSGGSGGKNAQNGGSGRFIFGSNTDLAENRPGAITGAHQTITTGVRSDNSFLADSGQFNENTPYIADLKGGAEVFGVLDNVTYDDLADLVNNRSLVENPGNDALVAVVRLDTGPEIYNVDYTGFDMVLMINLTDANLPDPELGIVLPGSNSGDYQADLMIGGVENNPLYGGSGYQSMGTLGANQIWATLVPETDIQINASIDGEIDALNQTALAVGDIEFISVDQGNRPELNDRLQGFDRMAIDASGATLYGVNSDQNALVVINAQDGTQRQLLIDGLDGVEGLAGASDVVISQDGNHVYVAGADANRIAVFSRDSNGNLNFVASVAANGINSLTLNESGNRVYVAGEQGIQAFNRGGNGVLTAATGMTTPNGMTGFTDISVSQDGSTVYAVSPVDNAVLSLSATNLSVLDTVSGTQSGLAGVSSVEQFGSFVYAVSETGNTMAVLENNNGKLALAQVLENGQDGVRGLLSPSDVTVSADGDYLMVTGAGANAVAVFARNGDNAQKDPGQLEFAQLVRNNVSGVDGLQNPGTLVVDPSGQFVYAGTLSEPGFEAGLVTFMDLSAGNALPEPNANLTTFSGIEALDVTTTAGNDTITVARNPGQDVANFGIETGADADNVILQAHGQDTRVNTGSGQDKIQVRSSSTDAELQLSGGDQDDRFEFVSLGANNRVEVLAGNGSDLISVAGDHIPASSTLQVNGQEPGAGSDTLLFDPEDPDPFDNQINYTPENFDPNNGVIQVIGRGQVNYQNVTVQLAGAPQIDFIQQPYAINEGDGVTFAVDVLPLGSTNTLSAEPVWDIDGDGQFGEFSGHTVTLSWQQLVDLGLNDSGTYQIGVMATNSDGFSTVEVAEIVIADTPPTVTLSSESPAVLGVGQTYRIAFSADDFGSDLITEWRVDWGDGQPVEILGAGALTAQHAYQDIGNYNVSVYAVDGDTLPDGTQSPELVVDVTVLPEQLSIADVYTISKGSSLTLSGDAPANPGQIGWDINGDGDYNDATGASAELSWEQLQALLPDVDQAGDHQYSIRMQATYEGADLQVQSKPALLRVESNPAAAALRSSENPQEGEEATVSIVSTQTGQLLDTVGYRFSFDLNNDGNLDIVESASPEWTIPAAQLADNGAYSIRAVIHEPGKDDLEIYGTVQVANVEPVLSVTGAEQIQQGEDYSLSLSATDPGDDTVDYWVVNWGDGTSETYFGEAVEVVHQFVANGSTEIAVSAVDEDGVYSTTHNVVVGKADFALENVQIADVLEDGMARLTGLITDVAANQSLSMTINWGDGQSQTVDLQTGATGTSKNFDVSHRYLDDAPSGTESDTYTISIAVTDAAGDTAVTSTEVTVSNQAPVLTSINLEQGAIEAGGTAVLTGIVSDIGELDTHSVTVDWGDGNTSIAEVNPVSDTFTASHQYSAGGQSGYTITAIAEDDDGGMSEAAITEVSILSEVIAFNQYAFDQTDITEGESVNLTGTFAQIGNLDAYRMFVEWGDGEGSEASIDVANRSFAALHTYQDDPAGSNDDYLVTLVLERDDGTRTELALTESTVIIDDQGQQITYAPTVVNVSNSAPQLLNLTTSAFNAGQVAVGEPVQLTGQVLDAGTLDSHTITVDWGDSVVETINLNSADIQLTHDYDLPGQYSISVSLADDDGATVAGQTQAILGGFVVDDNELYIAGTSDADLVRIQERGDGGLIVHYESTVETITQTYDADQIAQLHVNLGEGDDRIEFIGSDSVNHYRLNGNTVGHDSRSTTFTNIESVSVDAGSGTDTAIFVGGDTGGSGKLTAQSISSESFVAQGIPASIAYAGLEGLEVRLGAGSDHFTVDALPAGMALAIHGGAGDDQIFADKVATSVVIDGGAGNDKIIGGAGDDDLIGGLGEDELIGAAGNDILIADVGRVIVTQLENGSSRKDIVLEEVATAGQLLDLSVNLSDTAKTQLADAEQMLLLRDPDSNTTSALLLDVTSGSNDKLSGGAGQDMLFGQRGNDQLDGGADDDQLY
ncbi:MAG: PKD domain-containing protein, partial [Pseudomonadales bacterium]|nr:PKD domain-containing protein [Pseudomonadales bacterium]